MTEENKLHTTLKRVYQATLLAEEGQNPPAESGQIEVDEESTRQWLSDLRHG